MSAAGAADACRNPGIGWLPVCQSGDGDPAVNALAAAMQNALGQ
jgi:hypothetical protein